MLRANWVICWSCTEVGEAEEVALGPRISRRAFAQEHPRRGDQELSVTFVFSFGVFGGRLATSRLTKSAHGPITRHRVFRECVLCLVPPAACIVRGRRQTNHFCRHLAVLRVLSPCQGDLSLLGGLFRRRRLFLRLCFRLVPSSFRHRSRSTDSLAKIKNTPRHTPRHNVSIIPLWLLM